MENQTPDQNIAKNRWLMKIPWKTIFGTLGAGSFLFVLSVYGNEFLKCSQLNTELNKVRMDSTIQQNINDSLVSIALRKERAYSYQTKRSLLQNDSIVLLEKRIYELERQLKELEKEQAITEEATDFKNTLKDQLADLSFLLKNRKSEMNMMWEQLATSQGITLSIKELASLLSKEEHQIDSLNSELQKRFGIPE